MLIGPDIALVNTTIGSVPSVPEATCTPTNTGAAVELTAGEERHLDKSLVGHWVEVSGMLKKAKGDRSDLARMSLALRAFGRRRVVGDAGKSAGQATFTL